MVRVSSFENTGRCACPNHWNHVSVAVSAAMKKYAFREVHQFQLEVIVQLMLSWSPRSTQSMLGSQSTVVLQDTEFWGDLHKVCSIHPRFPYRNYYKLLCGGVTEHHLPLLLADPVTY